MTDKSAENQKHAEAERRAERERRKKNVFLVALLVIVAAVFVLCYLF